MHVPFFSMLRPRHFTLHQKNVNLLVAAEEKSGGQIIQIRKHAKASLYHRLVTAELQNSSILHLEVQAATVRYVHTSDRAHNTHLPSL